MDNCVPKAQSLLREVSLSPEIAFNTPAIFFLAMGLDWQNNNSAHASRFSVHFFTVTARLRRRVNVPSFTFCGGRMNK